MAFSQDLDNRFGVQRNPNDAYMLQAPWKGSLRSVDPEWSENFGDSHETEVEAIMEDNRWRELSKGDFAWKFRQVRNSCH